jgi:hypothetical protein
MFRLSRVTVHIFKDIAADRYRNGVGEPLKLLALNSPCTTQPRKQRACTNQRQRIQEHPDQLTDVSN